MSIWNPLTWFNKKTKSKENVDGVISSSVIGPEQDNSHLDRRPNGSSESQTLSDIVRGIAHAACAANEIQDQQFIKQIGHYFHKESDGTLVPKVVRAKMGDGSYIEVPLISMIDPSSLGLKEMEVRMGIRLSKSDIKKRVHEANRNIDVSRSSFSVALTGAQPGKRQDVIDVTMKFIKTDPAEGSSRLVDEMNGIIQPHKYDDNTKKPDILTNVFTTTINKDKNEDEDENDFEPHDHVPDESDGLKLDTDDSSSSSSEVDS